MDYLIIKEEKIIGYSILKEDAIDFASKKKASVWKKLEKYDFREKINL